MTNVNTLDSNNLQTSIYKVCYECGVTANVLTCLKRYSNPPKQISFTVSTYGNGVCDYCHKEKTVTEARDFFYPDFSLIQVAIDALVGKDNESSL